MADHHALGFAGGAGGVDDVGQVGAVALRRRFGLRGGPDLGPGHQGHYPLMTQCVRQRLTGQHLARAGIGEHERQALDRVVRVQRQVRTAGLERTQQGNDDFQRALAVDRHDFICRHALGAQGIGHLVGARIQLGIGQALTVDTQGDALRMLACLLAEQLLQETARQGLAGGVRVEALDQAGQLCSIDQTRLSQAQLGRCQQLTAELDKLLQPFGQHRLRQRTVETRQLQLLALDTQAQDFGVGVIHLDVGINGGLIDKAVTQRRGAFGAQFELVEAVEPGQRLLNAGHKGCQGLRQCLLATVLEGHRQTPGEPAEGGGGLLVATVHLPAHQQFFLLADACNERGPQQQRQLLRLNARFNSSPLHPSQPWGVNQGGLTTNQGDIERFFEGQAMAHDELLLQVAPERGALVADVFFAQRLLPGAVVQVLQRVLVFDQGFAAQQTGEFSRQHPQRGLVEAARRGQQRDDGLPCFTLDLCHHQHLIRIFNQDFTAAAQGLGHRRLVAQHCQWQRLAQALHRPLHARQAAVHRAQGFVTPAQCLQRRP
ncbi:hypothetical protein D3C71_1201360 [compost metagenome]